MAKKLPLIFPALLLLSCSGGIHRPPDAGTDAEDGTGPADQGGDPGGDLAGDAADPGADQGSDGGSDPGPAIGPWLVFRLADENVPMSQNLLANPDLESVSGNALTGWNGYQAGYQAGLGEGRSGNAILLARAAGDTAQYGAYQSIQLDRHETRPLFFSGWSKAAGLTGDPDSSASIYLDIQYMTVSDDPERGCDPATSSPCALYGQIPSPPFDTGTHDWQMRQGFAVPAYPIKSVSFYVLLRG